MTVRVVIAAVIAAAVVAAALPAVDTGRERATDRQVRGELDDLERAAGALLATEEAAWDETAAPQRAVSVTLPGRSWRRASVDRVVIRPAADGGARITYAVDGRRARNRTLAVPLRPAEADALVLRGSGDHRLRLRLVREDGERVVVVDRHGR
ncbi:hypothetical protein G9464_07525 [Halostella sp. JP-L12]|uniref:DUF7311 family protein n=1 Tax=Halostella TaxID=1843185 RepID=UPI000EF7621E|nr:MULTISPECIES: hypothetical protein [Halostella]NHN47444.1 hypothetical protein [Halostella sp. JP-L12]